MDEVAVEEIMRTRLLTDERSVLKRCVHKYLQLQQQMTPDEASSELEPLLSELEHYFRKQTLVQRVQRQEMQAYERQSVQLGEEIQQAEQAIRSLQQELLRAKEERLRKLEYDQIAATINQLPSRETTARRIEDVRQEQERLRALAVEQDALWARRQSQLHETFRAFERVQQDFRKHPTMDESRFYGGVAVEEEE